MTVTLTTPLRLGSLEVAGRLFKSATGETRALANGVAGDALIEFYEPMAIGGVPLIILGNAYVSKGGKGIAHEIGADADDKIPGLAALAASVRRHGSAIFGQINHCGRQVSGAPDPVSASDVLEPATGTRPRPLRRDEIPALVADFAAAAERLQRAGFDGVQLHMAHGYLVSQFLTPHTNRRSDEYGGSLENRLRIGREILAATRERVGPDFPIIAKLNGHDKLAFRDGLGPDQLVRMAQILEADGLDGIEISVSHYESGMQLMRGTFGDMFNGLADGWFKTASPARRRALSLMRPLLTAYGNAAWRYTEGFNLDLARQFTAALTMPVISVGGWQHRDAMEAALNDGGCDAVSAGRGFIADPLFFRHAVRDGAPRPACTFCNACVAYTGEAELNCFNPPVRAARDRVLREELNQTHATTGEMP
jgi:2,4-dienoyl-CoA reductase-like NADH-dependent reductase (Old Yellow Enzyme family)